MRDSLREVGQVVEISGSLARIVIQRHSSCESCGACGMGAGKEISLNLKNAIGAAVGDRVVVEMRSKALYKAVFLMYILPLFALIIGYLIGQKAGFAWGFEPDGAENFGILSGFLFLIFTYLIIKWLDRRRGISSKVEPQLVEVIRGEKSS